MTSDVFSTCLKVHLLTFNEWAEIVAGFTGIFPKVSIEVQFGHFSEVRL